MIKEGQYRIVYFLDTRTNKESYVIVKGTYLEANKMRQYLIDKSGYAQNVSDYKTLNNTMVIETLTGVKLKGIYEAVGQRSFWGGK